MCRTAARQLCGGWRVEYQSRFFCVCALGVMQLEALRYKQTLPAEGRADEAIQAFTQYPYCAGRRSMGQELAVMDAQVKWC